MNTTLDYKRLAGELLAQAGGTQTKAVSSTPSTTYAHGPGGLVSLPGISQNVFNAMMLPHLGLQRILPVRRSNEMNPFFAIMTGVSATSGSNPSGVCDDFKTAGLASLCTHSAVYGRIGLQTEVMNIDRAGQTTNRGEFLDLNLVGNPIFNNANVPTVQGASSGNVLRDEAGKKMFELAASWANEYAPLLYTGNPSNNTAGGGYKEYYGLEALINTGYRDAETGEACAAADSIVHSFGNAAIQSASADIVGLIQDIFFRLRHIATRTGLGNVQWALTMPLGMFYRLTEVWAYYAITRALDGLSFNSSVQATVSGAEAAARRDEMRGNLQTRTGQFLLVDGQRIPVIIDDAIPESEVAPGTFSSDIYIVPLTVLGGTPVTYMEAVNFDAPNGAMEVARQMAPNGTFYTTDNGTFIWTRKPPTNWCVQTAAMTFPRLIVRTPYIAARITNVAWSPLTEHERSPFTTSDYFAGGGVTNFAGYGPSFYSPTS